MKWRYFHILFNKPMTGALIAIFIIPVIADMLRHIGVDSGYLKTPVIGGIIFVICFFIYKYYCPEIISQYRKQQDYADWAASKNINIYEQLTMVKNQPEIIIRESLGNNADVLYPIDNGLKNARELCQREYAKIEYQLQDRSIQALSSSIAIVAAASIVMINWFSIERLYRLLGG